MANTRTIQSPGVEIREVDLSQRAVVPTGTTALVVGYAPQGPTYELVEVSTLAEFETAYGTPTNAAERYFYWSARQILTQNGNSTIKVARLPYGEGSGEGISSEHSALAYPVVAIPTDTTTYNAAVASAGLVPLSASQGFYFGEPALVSLTEEQYNTIKQGGLNWASHTGNVGLDSFTVSGTNVLVDLAKAGLIVLNKAKTTVNEKFEGYYFSIADSFSNNPATNYDDVVVAKTVNSTYFVDGQTPNYIQIPASRLGFQLSATYTEQVDSFSEVIENIPTFNIAVSAYSDTLITGLVRLRPSPFSPSVQTLQYSFAEQYFGSLYASRQTQSPQGGQPQSFFLQTVANDNSAVVNVLVNPYISNNTDWLDANGNPTKKVRVYKNTTGSDNDTFYATASAYLATNVKNSTFNPANNLYPLGVYSDSLPTWSQKVIGNTGAKLDYVLNLAENPDLVNLDLTVDAGLSTIYAVTQALGLSAYDDTVVNNALLGQVQALSASDGNPVSNTLVDSWNAITGKFVDFASNRRKDHVFISDPLRQIFVVGENTKTLDDKTKNFSSNIYWPLRNSYTAYNTSYATSYANWVKARDTFASKNVWLPSSGYAAATICRSDAATYQWTAPAGLTRGVVTGIIDLGVNPQQKQRDLVYKISLNPLVYFPNEGFVLMGQKTLLKAPSAFDRLNVRRLFLFLEKATLRTMRYFVFEPNTNFTRSRVINTLSPVFTLAKNTQGLYDYLIVCNETNNTPDVIDDNTMIVDIYIKPVRTAEFILVNFYCTKTSQNFNELIQG